MTAQPRARRSPRTSSAAAAAVQLAAPPRAPLGLALASAHLEKLKPGELSTKARAAAAAFAAHAQAANTTRSYRTAMEYWQAWHLVRYGMELPLPQEPVPVEAVLQFLVDHALRPKSSGSEKLIHELPLELDKALVAEGVKDSLGPMALSTLNHRISVLSSVHRQAEASLMHISDRPGHSFRSELDTQDGSTSTPCSAEVDSYASATWTMLGRRAGVMSSNSRPACS